VTRAGTAQLAAACQTDAGRVRTNNEDLFVCDAERGIFAVIDGVGGQSAGEVAAAIAKRVMLDRLARPLGTAAERVREAIALANNEIFKASEECAEHRGMTCVLTLALVIDQHVTIGHVGDSRLYALSPRGIRKMTHDHSPVGEREDARELNEPDAMRHPRRNEVFRDVGSAHRDKDEAGFVEIVEDTIADDSALLLCTDGLTDFAPASTIARVVRDYAGDPQAVADVLVAAANDAGGGDNVTVVYAESPEFARGVRAAWSVLPTVVPPTMPSGFSGDSDAPADAGSNRTAVIAGPREGGRYAGPERRRYVGPERRRPTPAGSGFSGTAKWIAGHRATWLAIGIVLGVASALALAWRLGNVASSSAPRTLIVGSGDAYEYTRIAEAVAAARPGDVVQLEPGAYAEQVALPDGVDLVARVPGKATLTGPAAPSGEWRAVSAIGSGRISGLRIVSTPAAPFAAAIRISGTDRRVEMTEIEGPMAAAFEIVDASGITVNGSLVRTTQGPAVVIDGSSDVTFAGNTFVATGTAPPPALRLKGDVRPILTRNLFAGYRLQIIGGASADISAQLLSGNFIVASEPAIAR
jgi:serine/threonine protein phosphatase PrpC